ncbi:hypothetical protein BJ878DRAFT_78097 [Calycina marina]|uniref:Uncharacterized protein n=1 Tax=Calycina marina TaxID=1763456 RepID=A0A9P7Z2W1_9HELO|nr:hypothetical protein BJ878DRAFT_78097 [Calycina marina]
MANPPPYSLTDIAPPHYTSTPPSYTSLPPPHPHPPALPRNTTSPSLSFRLPPTLPNPNTHTYQSVASRRAFRLALHEQTALLAAVLSGEDAVKRMRKRMADEERMRCATLEDPVLVGEIAAAFRRREREMNVGWYVLEREDRRWDWLLSQMGDWEGRDRSWRKYRRDEETGKRVKLASSFGLGPRKEGA